MHHARFQSSLSIRAEQVRTVAFAGSLTIKATKQPRTTPWVFQIIFHLLQRSMHGLDQSMVLVIPSISWSCRLIVTIPPSCLSMQIFIPPLHHHKNRIDKLSNHLCDHPLPHKSDSRYGHPIPSHPIPTTSHHAVPNPCANPAGNHSLPATLPHFHAWLSLRLLQPFYSPATWTCRTPLFPTHQKRAERMVIDERQAVERENVTKWRRDL